jgi:hypothetical protein
MRWLRTYTFLLSERHTRHPKLAFFLGSGNSGKREKTLETLFTRIDSQNWQTGNGREI